MSTVAPVAKKKMIVLGSEIRLLAMLLALRFAWSPSWCFFFEFFYTSPPVKEGTVKRNRSPSSQQAAKGGFVVLWSLNSAVRCW